MANHYFTDVNNEQFAGYEEEDTYYFSRGNGADYIYEGGVYTPESVDRIVMGPGISAGDIRITANAGRTDMIIQLLDNGVLTGDQITIQQSVYSPSNQVEILQLASGQEIDLVNVTYEFHDENNMNNLAGVSWGSNAFYSGAGDDYINGMQGSDAYYYFRGDGADTIYDFDGEDTLYLDAAICLDDLHIVGDNNDLVINILENGVSTGDKITIRKGINYEKFAIENIQVHGLDLKLEDIIPDVFEYYGTDDGEQINGGDHHKNIFYLGAGNDRAAGSDKEDVFYGGEGRDRLLGYEGADTYHFNRGDSRDEIYEDGRADEVPTTDKIVFGEGITLGDLDVSIERGFVVLDVLDGGVDVGDSVQIKGADWYEWKRVEVIEFNDGSSITLSGLLEMTVGDPLLG